MATKAITMLKQDDKAGGVRAETLGLRREIRVNDEIVLVAHGPVVRFTPIDQAACDSQFSSTPPRSGSFEVAPGRPVKLTALTAIPGGFQELFSGENAILHADAIPVPIRDYNGVHPDPQQGHPDPGRPQGHPDPGRPPDHPDAGRPPDHPDAPPY
jgi:hypothetical protein